MKSLLITDYEAAQLYLSCFEIRWSGFLPHRLGAIENILRRHNIRPRRSPLDDTCVDLCQHGELVGELFTHCTTLILGWHGEEHPLWEAPTPIDWEMHEQSSRKGVLLFDEKSLQEVRHFGEHTPEGITLTWVKHTHTSRPLRATMVIHKDT